MCWLGVHALEAGKGLGEPGGISVDRSKDLKGVKTLAEPGFYRNPSRKRRNGWGWVT